jgi:hypothetical protein
MDGPKQECKPISEMTDEELKAYARLINSHLRTYDAHTHTDTRHLPDGRETGELVNK